MVGNQQEARTVAISDRDNDKMTPTFSLIVLGTAILLIVVMISKKFTAATVLASGDCLVPDPAAFENCLIYCAKTALQVKS